MEFLNKDDKNYYENCYKVTVAATSFLVYANAPDQALELFVADAEINNPHLLYDFDSIRDYVYTTFEDEYREWLSNKSGEEYSYDDSWFDFAIEYLNYIYEDATEYGASQPYFVDGSVVSVEETNDEPIVFEDKEPKKEFLDADVNISTGDISSNLDLGGLGALAGLVASEEPKESEEKLEETRIPAQKLIDKYKDTDKVTFKDIKADLDSYSPEASDETIEGLMAQVKAGLEALGFKANETELVKESKSKKEEIYFKPDEENIIWSSEDSIDDYDIDEMKEIYQDYLDEFDSEMKPMTYEDWLFSEECSDYFYYEWVDVAKENPKYAEFYDFITEYVDDEQKEDAYNDYVEQCKNTTLQPDDFETWFDNYRIDHGDEVWSWKEDDLKENIFPAIDKQLNDNILLLSGSYGSNYPDFRPSGDGGVMWENGTDDFRAYMGNFDSVAITTMNGILGAICGDHDGTVSGQFYTLPDDKTEFIKALGYEDIIKERYDEEDLDKYNESDLMETEFNNDLYYGGIDARDLNQHIDLLKPIKDTISGYTPQDPEGTKTESKETLTEEKIFLDGVLADKLDKETDLNFDNVDMNSLKVVYGKLEALVEKIYEDRKIDNVEKEITDILSRANVTANSLPTTTTVQEAFNLAQVIRTQVSNKLVDEFGYDVLYEDKKIESEQLTLSDDEKSILRSYGEDDKSIEQVERALNVTEFRLFNVIPVNRADMYYEDGDTKLEDGKPITADEARKILGLATFMSGMDRSAFHWDCGRYNDDETLYVRFDSSKLFEESKELKTEDVDKEVSKYEKYIDNNTKQHLEKLEKDLLAIDGVTKVEYDLAPYADNMKSPIILVHYDQMNTSFKLLKSVVETIQANGLKVEMEELEDNDTYFYIVTYTNNWSKVTESKKLKKENPQQDEAVNSFFNQMDKYMDSKGTDMEALKGIETTANDVYKFRPEFTDMRYGDMYRALSKEYVRENKLTEALVRKLNKITETLKKESSINGEWLDKDNVDNYREGTVWVEVDIDPDYIEIDYENEDTDQEWLDKVFKIVQTKATEYNVKVMDLIQAPNGYSVVLKGTLQDIVDYMYDQKNYSIDKCIDDMDIEISREPLQERLLGPSDEVVADSKAKGLYTEDDNDGAKDEIKKDLGIEPGSDEEAQLDSLFDERNELSDKGLATDFKVGDVVKDIVDGDTAIIEVGSDAHDENYQTGKYLLRFVDGVCRGDAYWYTKGRFELVEDPELEKEAQETYKQLKDKKQNDIKTEGKKRIATNIQWDIDEDDEYEDDDLDLPTEIEIPDDLEDDDEISDYISDLTGFCHKGFEIKGECKEQPTVDNIKLENKAFKK